MLEVPCTHKGTDKKGLILANAGHECKARMQGTNAGHKCKAWMHAQLESEEAVDKMDIFQFKTLKEKYGSEAKFHFLILSCLIFDFFRFLCLGFFICRFFVTNIILSRLRDPICL